MRTLDRLVQFDERSRSFPSRELTAQVQPRSYTWYCGTFLDQGKEGACVGFAWAHEAAAVPKTHLVSDALALSLYRGAQAQDDFPDNLPGTSVLAGAKVMRARGWVTAYRWAFGLTDALVAISRLGPCVLGLNWYEGMFEPDPKGFIHPSGDIMGGHAILALGVSVKNKTVTLHNSWGKDWGSGGRCLISWEDLDRLLREQGEVCVPVTRR